MTITSFRKLFYASIFELTFVTNLIRTTSLRKGLVNDEKSVLVLRQL
jgi:hypothetical protein